MTEPKSIYCPGCANPVPFEKNFCSKCGMNISAHKQRMLEKLAADQSRAAAQGAGGAGFRNPRAGGAGAGPEAAGAQAAGYAPDRQPSIFEAFIYPLKGQGPLMLILGFLFIIAAKYMCCLGFVASGYMNLFFFNIIETSSAGKSELPGWPDVSGIADLASATVMTAVLGALTFLPVFIYPALAVANNVKPNIAIVGVSVLWAAIYYPMALMVLAETRNMLAIMPWTIIMFIIKAPGRYFIICLLIFLSFAPYAIIVVTGAAAAKNGMPGGVLTSIALPFVYFYGTIVMCRLLGVFCAGLCKN